MEPPTSTQFSTFKDCIARRMLAHPSSRQTEDSQESDLDEFSSFLALESWATLPPSLHTASYLTRSSVPTDVDDLPLDTTPVSFVDTLISYGFVSDHEEALRFLRKSIADYVSDIYAAPPPWSSTRTQECEICEREVPLTYHHLIPRATHKKVLKKKWHPEEMLNSVAWLCRFVGELSLSYTHYRCFVCRPCHSMVHSVARTEELAREYYTIDLLLARDDVVKWRNYAAKQRFGVWRG